MTREEIIHELEVALLKFVKDVADGAAPSKVDAMPRAAGVLVELLALDQMKER